MAIIKQQSDHNDIQAFGYTDNESLNQSIYFERSAIIDSIVVDFTDIFTDPVEDIRVKCQIRRGVGVDNNLSLDLSVVDESVWYEDSAISAGEFTFALNSLSLDSGHYWFSILTNEDYSSDEFSLKMYREGEFSNRFIKVINGSGIYKTDESLKYKINGTWGESIPENRTFEHDVYTTTILRDTT